MPIMSSEPAAVAANPPKPARLSLTVEQLMAFSDLGREDFGRFAEILNNKSGCNSPAEELIVSLVLNQTGGAPVTPETLEEDMKEFRQNFEMMVDATRLFLHQYPAEVLGEDCGRYRKQLQRLKADAIDRDGESRWEETAEALLMDARDAIRRYPALVLSDRSWDEIRKTLPYV